MKSLTETLKQCIDLKETLIPNRIQINTKLNCPEHRRAGGSTAEKLFAGFDNRLFNGLSVFVDKRINQIRVYSSRNTKAVRTEFHLDTVGAVSDLAAHFD